MTTDEWRGGGGEGSGEKKNKKKQREEGSGFDDEARRKLGGSVTITRNGPRVFAYTTSEQAALEAERVIRQLVEADELTATVAVTRWHPIEEEWRDFADPLPQTEAERAAARARHEGAEAREVAEEGEYDYEVHADPPQYGDAVDLEGRLKEQGLPVKRRW